MVGRKHTIPKNVSSDCRQTNAGVPIGRNAFVAEAGLNLKVAPDMTLGLSYAGQVGARANDNACAETSSTGSERRRARA